FPQALHQGGYPVPRPRPATLLGETFLVDIDDDHPGVRPWARLGENGVVGKAPQAGVKAAWLWLEPCQHDNGQHESQPDTPVEVAWVAGCHWWARVMDLSGWLGAALLCTETLGATTPQPTTPPSGKLHPVIKI